ncbi:TAT-variant-translocated molybdopterin oxidoreductase [soil metagenome]
MANEIKTTRPFWRSMDELVGTPQFKEWASIEFSPEALESPSGFSRREWMKLAAASFVLMSLASCSRAPEQEIVPHVHAPKGRTPQKPQFFATTLTRGRESIGVIVTSFEGRPTKIEGNPKHPASLGATDTFAQAEALALCDPDRSQSVMRGKQAATWDRFSRELADPMGAEGACLLTGPITSPSMLDQIARLLKKYPSLQWHVHDPAADPAAATLRELFGQNVEASFDVAAAKVIVCFDCDLFFAIPGSVRYARDFADGRRVRDGATADSMNRLYVAEPSPTITGSKADHRRIGKPGEIGQWLESLAAQLGVDGAIDHGGANAWLSAVADDLMTHLGRSLVVAGNGLPARSHYWVAAINAALDNLGKTVMLRPVTVPQHGDLQSLTADMSAGKVQSLLVLDSNPAYDTPAFAAAVAKVPWKAHVGLYRDETALLCDWHVPGTHVLESWGDATAYDGTVSPIQPLIAPLYGGKSPREVLAVLLGEGLKTDYDLVADYWRGVHSAADFDAWWRACLRDGVMSGAAIASAPVPASFAAPGASPATKPDATGLEPIFRFSSSTYDGRYANNAWLQEMPDPITKLTWDNAAWLSPAMASRLGVKNGDVVQLDRAGASVRAPVFIVPGHANEAITLPLGYGRANAGSLGSGIGFNAYVLRASAGPIMLRKTGDVHALATTQEHASMEGRDLFRAVAVAQLNQPREEPKTVHLSLYPDRLKAPQQWGLSIDLTACIGCNACAIACQAENNIPIVGKEEVAKGREMSWIRIDRYFEGEPSDPEIHHQPVPCMQCENAPCETVCPVGATQHSEDGLNDMVYNRCIGTRYCSNNCPYKVRRFNFFQYTDLEHESLQIQRNPQVTVRSRGVMEKCTYCVQRIRNAQITAEIDPEHPTQNVADGVIQTACQQVCPTQAIVFGDIADKSSRVSKLKEQSHDYSLLEDLNTRPRTTYLAEVKNPNPTLSKEARA